MNKTVCNRVNFVPKLSGSKVRRFRTIDCRNSVAKFYDLTRVMHTLRTNGGDVFHCSDNLAEFL